MKKVKPISSTPFDEDMDGTETLHVFDQPPLVVIRRALGLTLENKWLKTDNDYDTRRDCARYRDSGLWSYYRSEDGRDLHFSVAVGCSCMHDCCGHLCGLSYVVTTWERLTLVRESRLFNY